jgi:putative endonuclease
MHYVYMLQSLKNKKTYIGSTNDLRKRLLEHNAGESSSTKADRPWKILYYEAFAEEKLARSREKMLKYDGRATHHLKSRLGLIDKKSAAYTRGFSTIELLIASALALMFLSAMFIVSFGDQSTVLSGQTNAEAVAKTQTLIEQEQANGRQDFNLANSTTSTDGIYKKSVSVTMSADFLTKTVEASTTWKGEHNQSEFVKVTTLITNIDNVNSPNTCNSSLPNPAGWKTPGHMMSDPGPIVTGNSGNGFGIFDLKVFNGRIYVTTYSNPNSYKDTLLVFKIPSNPKTQSVTFLGSVDNDTTQDLGPAQIAIASTTNKIYVYEATGARARDYSNGANFNSCINTTGTNKSCAQLQIIDATNPATLNSASVIESFKIPTTSPSSVKGSGGQAAGKSIFYKDGYVYLGLKGTQSGPEFNIIDVGGGTGSPTNPQWVGGYSVGFTVDSIYVRGDYAYLATTETVSGNKRLLILNVSDKTNPHLVSAPVGGFFTASGFGVGNIVTVVGNKIYFGTANSSPSANFYIIDGTNPGSYPSSLSQLGSIVAGTNDSVDGLAIKDYLAFLLTKNQFQVWNISNPSSMTPWTTSGAITEFSDANHSLSSVGAGYGTTLDCENDYIYTALESNTGNNKDIIEVFFPS